MHHPSPHPTAPTEQLPERRSRTGFFLTVGCLSVIAGLLLGVGGFFGVRALHSGGGAPVAEEQESPGGSDGREADERTDGAAEPTGETLAETPVGPDDAVPFGTAFPMHSSSVGAEIEVAVTEVDWEATAEVLDANSFTLEPAEGSKYVMFTLEGVHEGTTAFDGGYAAWIRSIYIDEEGTSHHRVFVVSPHYDEDIEQAGAEPGGEFRSELVFRLPAGLEGGGHLVLVDSGQAPEAGTWISMP